ncbi:hypothetical protein [Paraflavitalea speifideaquila]|uniref:hypothetical protein n=1 Tax=Paraflavitalea speifideaquila TaxID=3076558 RepID=UPI0028EFE74E|nr:hypothetical protein [Paraflavitalea speifideiaquila]
MLSGFLITYLLIREKEVTGTIHVGNFYIRRILRIWPLYFLCLFIGFVVFAILKKMGVKYLMKALIPGTIFSSLVILIICITGR